MSSSAGSGAEVPVKVIADFVAATGLSRVSVVQEFDKRYAQQYSPVTDWWLGMRRAAIGTVRHDDTARLHAAVSAAASNKQASYASAAAGLEAWHQAASPTFIDHVDARHWSRAGIDVKVRPDFVVDVNGIPTAVKMWFRMNPPLNQSRRDTHLYLMSTLFPEFDVGILVAQTGELHVPTGSSSGLDILLTGEAAAFSAMWVSLP